MKKRGMCDIDNTVAALEEAIARKKERARQAALQAEASHPMVPPFLAEMIDKMGGSHSSQINNGLEHGIEMSRDFIKNVQQGVEQEPWDALRKVAVASFGIGLFLSRRKHEKSPAGGRA